MRPEVHEVLAMLAETLLTNVAPLIEVEYVRKDTELMPILLMAAAEEYERGAEVRFRENEDMRGVFRAAAGCVDDPGLKQRLEEAASAEETSFSISSLNASNDSLRSLLIEVHESVESAAARGAPWAKGLDRQIWEVLQASVTRRAFTFYQS